MEHSFRDYFDNSLMYERFLEVFHTLSETPSIATIDKVEDLVKTNPYMLSQAIVASLIAAHNEGFSESEFFSFLADPNKGNTVFERLRNSPSPEKSFLALGQTILSRGFAAKWPKLVADLYDLGTNVSDKEIRAIVAQEPDKLSDLNSLEFHKKIIEPLEHEFGNTF